METSFVSEHIDKCLRFNRIYEEWKLIKIMHKPAVIIRFNRIYEEWKQQRSRIWSLVRTGFNRIYEEWKHMTNIYNIIEKREVQSNL